MAAAEELDAWEREAIRRVAANTRHWRRARGLTQLALATELEVSRATVRAIEGERHAVSLRMLASLALALDLDLPELLADRASPARPTGRPSST